MAGQEGKDGEETLRGLRGIRQDVRVLLMSGYDEQQLVDRFADEGLAGFVQKPFRAASLAEKLQKALG